MNLNRRIVYRAAREASMKRHPRLIIGLGLLALEERLEFAD